jgi:V8-like Glu-specific endopeptidase/cell wall-associated NlpC family hydrolase
MPAQIRPNRLEVSDRFPMLGFTIRTDGSPVRAEVAIATDPLLFRSDKHPERTNQNFYSSRASGALSVPRNEAVYLVPPEVLARFIGQEKLYFALATTPERTGAVPEVVVMPGEGTPYVSLRGLTGRSLKRVRLLPSRQQKAAGYGSNGKSALEWAGDTATPGMEEVTKPNGMTAGGSPAPTQGNGGPASPPAKVVEYDDGFGPMPAPSPDEGTSQPASRMGGPTTAAQSYYGAPKNARSLSHEDAYDEETLDSPDINARKRDEMIALIEKWIPTTLLAPRIPHGEKQDLLALAGWDKARGQASKAQKDQGVPVVTSCGDVLLAMLKLWRSKVLGACNIRDQTLMPLDSGKFRIGPGAKSLGLYVEADGIKTPERGDVIVLRNGTGPSSAGSAGHVGILVEIIEGESKTTWRTADGGGGTLPDQSAAVTDREVVRFENNIPVLRSPTDNRDKLLDGWITLDRLKQVTPEDYLGMSLGIQTQALGVRYRVPLVRAQEIVTPFYDPADPSTALTCQNDAFSLAREEWFVGVPNTRIFPHSAICQLLMTAPDGSSYQGTGFYIGRNRILTCAHNLHQMSSVTIIPGRNGAGDKPFGQHALSSSSWRIAPGYTGSGDWKNDLAVIDNVPLAAPNGQWFRFLNATPSDRLPIVVCGYSSGSRAVPELTEAIDGNAQHLHGGYATGQRNLEVIEYPILTLMGASGSPVYHLSNSSGQLEALVCAVHVTGEPAAEGLNRGCFMTPPKIDWIEGRTTAFSLSTRALEIPLDPGVGGMSIGVDALQPGDVIVSTARHAVSYAIRAGTLSAISHAMLYVGDGKIIEAVGGGVREVAIEQAIGDALLAVAYRDSRVNASITQAVVDHARSRVSNPYNYAGVAFTGYRILNPLPARIIDGIASRVGLEVGQAGTTYCSELVLEAFENAGVPLVASRPGASTPDDLVQLSRSVLAYVGHLKGEDAPLGIPLGVDDPSAIRRGVSGAMSGQSFAVHWDTAPYYPQSSNASCWAASAAMVVGWRDGRTVSDAEIADKVPVIDRYTTGMWPTERRALADAWDLVAEPPASYTIDTWRDMLGSYGPLYIDMTWNTAGGGHVRVLIGMESDGAPDGSDTTMFMHDPWPGTPGRIRLSFADFLALYEGRVGNSGGQLQYQLLHAAAVPAHLRATMAAPFSLAAPSDIQHQPPGSAPTAGRRRETGSRNGTAWELDQLDGFKRPAGSNGGKAIGTGAERSVNLDDWPYVSAGEGEARLPLMVSWHYANGAVGDVRITAGEARSMPGWAHRVTAVIADGPETTQIAAVRAVVCHKFGSSGRPEIVAVTELTLFGDGTYQRQDRWEQTQAAAA